MATPRSHGLVGSLTALVASLVGACAGTPHSPAEAGALRRELETLAAAAAPCQVSIAVFEPDGSTAAEVDATVVLHAASTMKIAVMIELFRRADAGALDLDARIVLRNAFASIVDGSTYSLASDDDSDPELYARVGTAVTLRELCERMIRRSSNLATNSLVELLDPNRVQATIEALGATWGMRVLRGVEDNLAYRAGLSNVTTARDLAVLLRAIVAGSAATPPSCRSMLDILIGQEFHDMIPAGLPEGTVVAHKTGTITRIHHDAAIVDPHGAHPYVLVVLTAGFDDVSDADRIGAEISRVVHAARR